MRGILTTILEKYFNIRRRLIFQDRELPVRVKMIFYVMSVSMSVFNIEMSIYDDFMSV